MTPPLWQKVKRAKKPLDESERGERKSWLRRSWHPVPSFHGKQMGKQWKQCQTLLFWAAESLQMVTAAMKLKDAYSLEEKL